MSTEPETTAAEAISVPSPGLSGEAAGPPAPPAAEDAAPGPGSTPAAPPERVSLRELGARISEPLHHAGGGPSWGDLYAAYDAAAADAARAAAREWSAEARQWSERVLSEMSRDSIRSGMAAQDAAGSAAA